MCVCVILKLNCLGFVYESRARQVARTTRTRYAFLSKLFLSNARPRLIDFPNQSNGLAHSAHNSMFQF